MGFAEGALLGHRDGLRVGVVVGATVGLQVRSTVQYIVIQIHY